MSVTHSIEIIIDGSNDLSTVVSLLEKAGFRCEKEIVYNKFFCYYKAVMTFIWDDHDYFFDILFLSKNKDDKIDEIDISNTNSETGHLFPSIYQELINLLSHHIPGIKHIEYTVD